ncbi:histidine kinase [Xiamenia xianingshaonis]|nr:histidine kinase [Xiamenia xianingshaonis]
MGRSEQPGMRYVMPRFFTLEMFAFTLAVLSGLVLLWNLIDAGGNVGLLFCAGVIFTLSLAMVVRLFMDPDWVRARQTDSMLKVASQTLACMDEGLDMQAAKQICSLLLPASAACAVAITDRERILAYEGHQEKDNPAGIPIKTAATLATLQDGKLRVLYTPEDIGLASNASIKGAIIVPLSVGHEVVGTLKFYYRRARQISETQKSIAEGFGKLLNSQMAATAMEEQAQLATRMELKMLQSQINPHFLFNTINTIASLVRTDPENARKLLREFATFYRRTLENSGDLIVFERELGQTQRYFLFEVARFGADRVALESDVEEDVLGMMVPAFIIQPLVENAVHHAMPAEGKLTVTVSGRAEGPDVRIQVVDDGIGMDAETCERILHPESSTGMGIAVKNVHDRIVGFYGPGTEMSVESELGVGTTVTLLLKGGRAQTVAPVVVE